MRRIVCAGCVVFGLLFVAAPAVAFGIGEREEREIEERENANDRPDDPVPAEESDLDDRDERVEDNDDSESQPEESDEPAAERNDIDTDNERVDEPDEEESDENAVDRIVIDDVIIDIGRAPIEYEWPGGGADLEVRLEADRRLLAELRKSIPMDRIEAKLYLRRIRELAAVSDPVSLVPLANNVIRQAPALYEWLETEYDDPEERARDYYIGGSWAFHRRFEAFRKAVLLTVIKRLDVVSDRLQGEL